MKLCKESQCSNKVFTHGYCQRHSWKYYITRTKVKKSKKKTAKDWTDFIKARSQKGTLKPVSEGVVDISAPQGTKELIVSSDKLQDLIPHAPIGSSGSYSNVQRGEYLCSKGYVYFRSKWEANYALFLDYLVKLGQIKGWEYETETFFFEQIKLGTRSYRPDFPVINNDGSREYHEVKGYMDSKSKTKLKRMRKYYPHIKVVLIDADYYKGLVKQFKTTLKFY